VVVIGSVVAAHGSQELLTLRMQSFALWLQVCSGSSLPELLKSAQVTAQKPLPQSLAQFAESYNWLPVAGVSHTTWTCIAS
jgi:hypothetical protein